MLKLRTLSRSVSESFKFKFTIHVFHQGEWISLVRPASSNSRVYRRRYANLPQQLDLLERYRGLVALGKIEYDEEQIRVVMQLRRLQRELIDYAPPALPSSLLGYHLSGSDARSTGPNDQTKQHTQSWWSYSRAEDEISLTSTSKSLVRLRTHAEELAALNTPKGLLLTGPPGSGKSFLVDMWLESLPTPYKTRKHYNQFVLEIYRAVWEETQRRMAFARLTDSASQPTSPWNISVRERWRELVKLGRLPTKWTRPGHVSSESTSMPIAYTIAKRLVLRHWLLVFDEVQLLDVSSAGLLADVLSWFWRMGGVVVGTSNKVPDDLYKNGVQRERLEPFVEALKMRCPVLTMRSESDWRQVKGNRSAQSTWFLCGQEDKFGDLLSSLQDDTSEPRSSLLNVFGRLLEVPWSSNNICKYTFAQLCEESLGPADYLTLASNYSTVVITSIPILKLSSKNQARRFISLIDALYEARCHLVCLAETTPENLFFPDMSHQSIEVGTSGADVMFVESVAETQEVSRPNVSSYDSPGMTEPPVRVASTALDTLSIFSGQDEQFAFKRALSRLIEMTSQSYQTEAKWTPLPLSSRKWEQSDTEQSPNPLSTDSGVDDFESPDGPREHIVGEGTVQPAAPQLSQDHVWGMRDDWGKRARLWGQGAKAYEKSTSKGPDH